MKSYKQRTLDAQKDLIRRYEENDPPPECPFWEIYWHLPEYSCTGCFMCLPEDEVGCQRFKSKIQAHSMGLFSKKQRLARANFHRKVRKILLKRPARYFTPSKWKYLDIPKEW